MMDLSAEQFAAIVSDLSKHDARKHASEMRRAPRVHQRHRVSIAPIVDGAEQTPVVVQLRDMSARGMCILYAHPLHAGSQLVVRLPRESGGTLEVLCTVAHCREVTRNTFSIGVEFTCQIEDTSLLSTAQSERISQSILQ